MLAVLNRITNFVFWPLMLWTVATIMADLGAKAEQERWEARFAAHQITMVMPIR